MGTYSGLVQVYVTTAETVPISVDGGDDTVVINTNNKNKAAYAVEWSMRLPYPVHAISHIGNKQLVVTTKRSLRVFEPKATITYSAARAKERLERIMEQQNKQ